MACIFCDKELVVLDTVEVTPDMHVVRDETGRTYLKREQERTCLGHIYLDRNLVPAVEAIGSSSTWQPGILVRVSGRTDSGMAFFEDLRVPVGRSPLEMSKIQLAGCEIFDELSDRRVTLADLYPHGRR